MSEVTGVFDKSFLGPCQPSRTKDSFPLPGARCAGPAGVLRLHPMPGKATRFTANWLAGRQLIALTAEFSLVSDADGGELQTAARKHDLEALGGHSCRQMYFCSARVEALGTTEGSGRLIAGLRPRHYAACEASAKSDPAGQLIVKSFRPLGAGCCAS